MDGAVQETETARTGCALDAATVVGAPSSLVEKKQAKWETNNVYAEK